MTAQPTAPPGKSIPSAGTPDHIPVQKRADALLLAETVRLIEQDGPLDDHDAMREAFLRAADDESRLLERGLLLARRLKLDHELARWRQAARGIILALALLAFLSAFGAATAVVGSGRTINAVTAFFTLLGVPSLTLLAWVTAVFSHGSALFGTLSFGNIVLRLLARLPGTPPPQAPAMANAAYGLLMRERLIPWAFGVASHATWAVSLLLVLVALGFAFSFQAYRLTWETTILDARFFARFVTLTGILPSWLGFPLPDAATVRDPSATGADHRAFAWWLMGCIFTYGLLPRVLFGILSRIAWRRGIRRAHLDTTDPYYRKLIARFHGMEASLIIDREQALPAADSASMADNAAKTGGNAVLGFELPPEYPWPPAPLPSGLAMVERLAGTIVERRAALDRIAVLHPGRLLFAVHAPSTPDRGTERFFREASRHAARAGLILLSADQGSTKRWSEWLDNSSLGEIEAFTELASALRWMEGEHA